MEELNKELIEEFRMIGYDKELKEKDYKEFIKTLIVRSTIERPMSHTVPHIILDGFGELEKYHLRVAEIILNNTTYTDIKKVAPDFLDKQSRGVKNNFEQGIRALMWGAIILVSNKLPDNVILFLSEIQHCQVSILKIIPEEIKK